MISSFKIIISLVFIIISNGYDIKKPGFKNFPTPTYEYLTCGAVWENNTTFISYDLLDYFAVVNSTGPFVVKADMWGVKPSSPACEAGAYLSFAPIGEGSYRPFEKYFVNGDSFNFTVRAVDPPVEQFDMMFFGEMCEYTISIKRVEIVC